MNNNDINVKSGASENEKINRDKMIGLFKKCPIPDNELLQNLSLFIKRQDMQQILFMNELYKRIVGIHGIIVEFGVRWGRNLALFESFRGIYEPFNYNRKIVGFDTFTGFPSVHSKDGLADIINTGSYNVTEHYDQYLEKLLFYHESESPISHIKKCQLLKGDAIILINQYLLDNPQTIIALAYFDFDIYEPTKKCLEAIRPHLTKGSVLGFDELNHKDYPGETVALREVLGLSNYRIIRSPYSANQSFLIIE